MSTTASIATQDITGMVLAGGRGSRMGAWTKGCNPFTVCRWLCMPCNDCSAR